MEAIVIGLILLSFCLNNDIVQSTLCQYSHFSSSVLCEIMVYVHHEYHTCWRPFCDVGVCKLVQAAHAFKYLCFLTDFLHLHSCHASNSRYSIGPFITNEVMGALSLTAQ